MTLKRVTITVKSDVLKRIDSMIDKKDIRNRSHAIEHLLKKSLNRTELDAVFIMAGGSGKALRPITYELPKPLIPIAGKPVLEHQINMFKKFGLDKFVVSINYMPEKVREYFGDGSKFNVSIKYIVEKNPLGTAGSLCLAKEYINGSFAMMNVDTLVKPDIYQMYEFHKKENSLATLLLASSHDPSSFGVAKMRGNKILEFSEKPKKAKSNLINAGFCIFDRSVMDMVPKRRFMIQDLFNRLSSNSQLSGFVHDTSIFDIGTNEGYGKAIKTWKP